MTKYVLPVVAAIALAGLLFGPARQLLPASPRLQTEGTLVSDDQHESQVAGTGTGLGLAPAPVLNPPAAAVRLSVAVEPLEKTEHGYSLDAKVLAPDGKPLADASVTFFELVELFGQREMLLGTGTTDGRGFASYDYLPARTGTHRIVVRFGGRDTVKAGEARTSFEATVAAPERHAERTGLASFSDRVPYVVGVLVLAVWALIAFALFATARGVIVGARRTRGKEELA